MGKAKKNNLPLLELLEKALLKDEDRPYEVPQNWVWTKIEFINNYTGKLIDPIKEPNRMFELYSVPSYDNDYPEIVLGSEIGSTKQKVSKGDVLLCKINPRINRVWIVSQHTEYEQIASSEWIVINNNILNSRYLMRYLSSKYFREYLLSNVSGVGGSLMRAQPKFVKEYPIPIPPLAEQQRIVDVIESLFEKLDTAKELVQNALDSFESRKAAILHKAFIGELTAKWRQENGVSLEEWEKKTLKSLCKISSGGTPSRMNKNYFAGEIPWIKTGEINWNFISNSEEKITECAIKNSSAKLFPIGTVLVAMYGQGLTRGRAAILEIEAATNQAVCALRPNSKLLNKFLYYYFMDNYWNFREKAVGGNQPNFSGTIIGGFLISIPSLAEQTEIINILDNLLGNELHAKELCDVIEKIDLIKKAILARAFRGELGTNDPEEESAVELLKEILKDKKS